MANKISKYFFYEELIVTAHKEVDNTPSDEIKVKLGTLANDILDRVRELLDCPVRVNSGYRSVTLNTIVGGQPTSQHCKGEAADIVPLSDKSLLDCLELILGSTIPYDQIIYENSTWIHISMAPPDREPRHQALMYGTFTSHRYLPFDRSAIPDA